MEKSGGGRDKKDGKPADRSREGKAKVAGPEYPKTNRQGRPEPAARDDPADRPIHIGGGQTGRRGAVNFALSLALALAAALLIRRYVFEAFKIPTGSMEPTLVGHEDFGDRIYTNKLAFSGLPWVGSEPKRFDVVVFRYDSDWDYRPDEPRKPRLVRNFIKRLVGLPSETILISGGDLYIKDRSGYHILRKPPEILDSLWYPIADTRFPTKWSADEVPWLVEASGGKAGPLCGTAEAPRLDASSTPVFVRYRYKPTNVYVKAMRHPFVHDDCPGPAGGSGEPRKTEFTAYIPNAAAGVRCPVCGMLRFPLQPRDLVQPPKIYIPDPNERDETKRFYGGREEVGDLKLLAVVEPEDGKGIVELAVEENGVRCSLAADFARRKASASLWLPGAGGRDGAAEELLMPGGSGGLELAVAHGDGAMHAWIGGRRVFVREYDKSPLGSAKLETSVRLRADGGKFSVRRLALFRDIFYLPWLEGGAMPPAVSPRHKEMRTIDEKRKEQEFRVPPDMFLLLGDNSPSSTDGRRWGFVPKSEMVGRASFIWWPPSRWRVLR